MKVWLTSKVFIKIKHCKPVLTLTQYNYESKKLQWNKVNHGYYLKIIIHLFI